ncbi:MAG: N-acetyltransferase [Acidimicrobiales bacterium]|nr:MAG: N-acetyltransferase [Acidimicrobiales bacterium]
MPITVRRIQPDDVDLLRRVRLAALRDTPDAFAKTHAEESVYPDEFWDGRARSNASGPEHTTFFAFDGGDCVGLVGGHQALDGDHVDLVSMWTDPAARGRGVGAALVAAVLEWADGRTVELWVTHGNDGAKRLYERCGFVETGAHQALPSDPCKDEIRMRRTGG